MTIAESAAYLKGMIEGLGIDPDSTDGKLWGKLTELLSDMAHEIEDLQASDMDHADALDEIADELSYLEELTCDLDTPKGMYDDYEDDPYCSGDCSLCPGCPEDDDEDEEDDDEDDDEDDEDESDDEDEEELDYDGVMYDVICPVCGEEITLDEDTLKEGFINCPSCGERLEFDLSEDEKE